MVARVACWLPQRGGQRNEHGQHQHRRDRHAAAVTVDELARSIPVRRRMRQHRLVVEVPFDVVRQRTGRGVAALRVDGGGLDHDVVEVAAQMVPPCPRSVPIAAARDHAQACGWRAGLADSPSPAHQQFVEQDAERVHIGGRGHRLARELLRRGIGWRERAVLGAGGVVGAVVEQLGDAEVEQLHLTVGGDQHVGWLQIAMHDQRAMRRGHRAAHLQEQQQARAQRQAAIARVIGDRHAVDQFQHDVGQPLFGDTALDQPCDARMAQARQRLALAPELVARRRRVQAAGQQLEGDLLAHASLLARGAEHGGGAAFAEHLDQFEGVDPAARRHRRGDTGLADRARRVDGVAGQPAVVGAVGAEHAFDLLALVRIEAVRGEPVHARGAAQLQRRFEQFAQCRGGVHVARSCRLTCLCLTPLSTGLRRERLNPCSP